MLAKHVTFVHMHNRHPDTEGVVFSPHEVRQYVAQARSYRPTVPHDVSEYMVKAYVGMRDQQGRDEKARKQFAHTSPRTLLGVLRLSQALARLRFSDVVVVEDVDEALRLVDASKQSLYAEQSGYRKDLSPSSKIYNLVRALAESGACLANEDDEPGGELSIRKVQERIIAKGFTIDQFQKAIEEYAELDVRTTLKDFGMKFTNCVDRFGKLLVMVLDWCLLNQWQDTWHEMRSWKECCRPNG
jgi:DNA replication licensing factor MCM7